jgi:DHA1 family bicyclomycin/chloramphenicol resistance-like MFS transporter
MIAWTPDGAGQVDPMNARLLTIADSDASTALSPSIAPNTHGRSLRVMAILSVLMGFGSISTDIYLPALPTMGQALGSDNGTMELTISGYLVGFSLGQLLWGPIGDRYGRRLPVAAGILLFVIGSAGCALSDTAWQMIGWRVLQAVGACAGVVLARAMVRDMYDRDRAAQMLSTLIVIMAIAPLIGPLVGGQILAFASWHVIFWLLVGVGLLTLAALFTLPETLAPSQRNREPLINSIAAYGHLLRQRAILGYAGVGAFFYLGVYAYIAGTPFAYISYYHVPAQLYGLLFGSVIAGIMVMNMVNTRLVTTLGSDRLLRLGTIGAAIFGVGVALVAGTGWGGLAGLATMLFLFSAMSGLIVANSIAGALARFPERAGTASALVGAIHYGAGIVGSALVGAFADDTPWPVGWVVGIAGIGSLLCARLFLPAARIDRKVMS